jgi:hypothetical protein
LIDSFGGSGALVVEEKKFAGGGRIMPVVRVSLILSSRLASLSRQLGIADRTSRAMALEGNGVKCKGYNRIKWGRL